MTQSDPARRGPKACGRREPKDTQTEGRTFRGSDDSQLHRTSFSICTIACTQPQVKPPNSAGARLLLPNSLRQPAFQAARTVCDLISYTIMAARMQDPRATHVQAARLHRRPFVFTTRTLPRRHAARAAP